MITTTISDIKRAHNVNSASYKSLEYLGQIIQTVRNTNETDEHYRARLKTMWQRYAGSGTIPNIKTIASTLLLVGTNRIIISEDFSSGRYASFDVWIWVPDLTNAGILVNEFKSLLESIKPTGVEMIVIQKGTFTCRRIIDSNNPIFAYDDIAHSNPTGGTYASLV